MSQNIFQRLKKYYTDIGIGLKAEAKKASIFPNTSDIGVTREMAYVRFLESHVPLKCHVRLGGFLFDEDGNESKQLDILITTDTTPKFDMNDGSGKSFSPVEGALAVISVKSTLDKKQLYDALEGLASIPLTKPLGGRVHQLFILRNYDDWPFKVIYASDAIRSDTLTCHLNEYYENNDHIPVGRRVNLVHVIGKYYILRAGLGQLLHDKATGTSVAVPEGTYIRIDDADNSDVQAMTHTLDEIQNNANASTHILFSYKAIYEKIRRL